MEYVISLALLASQCYSLPGFMIPFGSIMFLICFINSTVPFPSSFLRYPYDVE